MTSPFVDRVEYQVIGRDTNASKVFRDVANAADDAGDSVDGLGGHVDRLNQSIDATAVRMRALIAAMRGLSNVDIPAIGFGDIDTAELERANRQLADLVIQVDRAGEATVRLGTDLDNAGDSMRDVATSTGNTAATFDSLRSNVDGSRTAITGITTDFRNLGRSVEDGRVLVIRFRDDLTSTAVGGRNQVDTLSIGFRNLSTDIETSRGRLADLFSDVQRAGNIDIRQHIDIGKSVVETISSDRDRLERAGLVAGATIGGGLMLGIVNMMTGAWSKIPIVGPLMTAVIGGLAAVSAPLAAAVALLMSTVAVAAALTLTAALGAAILAAFAGGAILAGVLIQLRDPAVKKAFVDTGNMLVQAFQKATAAFVPVIQSALLKVQAAVEQMGPQLSEFFDAAATYVEPLTDAVLGFIKNALPGMTRAMQNMKPIIDELSKWIPKLGKTVGDLFERLGKNSDNLAKGLGYVLGAVNEAIKFFGILIEEAAKAMDWIEDLWHTIATVWNFLEMGDAVGDVFNGIKITAQRLFDYLFSSKVQAAGKHIQEGFKPLLVAREYVAGLKTETEKLAEATERAMRAANDFLGLGDSQAAMYEAMRAGAEHVAKATGKDLKQGIDWATEAGDKNWQMLANIARTANRAAQDILDMGGTTADAAAVTNIARQKFMEFAGAMNIGAKEAEILANRMFGIPDVDPKVTVDTAQAEAAVKYIQKKINGVHGKVVTITTILRTTNKTPKNSQGEYIPGVGLIPMNASGGPILGPGPKGIDSKLHLLAPGEHVLTAQEVDAAGGHANIMEFRRSLLNQSTGPRIPFQQAAERSSSWSAMDNRSLGMALRKALSGMTLVLDDRTGRTAHLIARGG